MSFITSPGVIVPPLTAGGVAYGTGSQAKVTSAGTVGQVLTSNGAGVPKFITPASGGVTSVAMTVPSVLSISGSPITSAGTLAVGYSGTALPVANGGTGATTLTANNVILGNGTAAPSFVAPGASGNVLQSNGTTWTSAAAAGGAMVLVQSKSPPSASTILEFTEIPTTYKTYKLILSGMNFSGSGFPNVQIGTGASPTYITSGYIFKYAGSDGSGSFSSASYIQMFGGGSSQGPFSYEFTFYNLTTIDNMMFTVVGVNGNRSVAGGGQITSGTIGTAIKIELPANYSAGNGYAALYGISS